MKITKKSPGVVEVDILIDMYEDFTRYDIKPEGFLNYLRYYGEHFNKKLCEFACSEFEKKDYDKEKIDQLLKANNIELENAKLYDSVYIANYLKSLFFGSNIVNERNIFLFMKDLFDKEGDLLFNRWYADCAKKGIPIDWEEMI